MEQGKPFLFRAAKDKGIKLDGLRPLIIDLNESASADDCRIHDERDFYKAHILVRMFDDPTIQDHMLRPFGLLY
ncbi:hypothetical protein [Flavihumibacter solisilvae]|uniref:hypothetical protein n=1 Tax=Flavihumibacter solisilvae TaxID=1349421 RepID=UPI000B18A3F0|nr:hypothetical protein [Flavihumibacter solisilvae]